MVFLIGTPNAVIAVALLGRAAGVVQASGQVVVVVDHVVVVVVVVVETIDPFGSVTLPLVTEKSVISRVPIQP